MFTYFRTGINFHQPQKHKRICVDDSMAGHEVLLFWDLLLRKRTTLTGHIVRTDNTQRDPLRQAAYSPDSANSYTIGKRRVGGPRQQWHHLTKTCLGQFDGRTGRI